MFDFYLQIDSDNAIEALEFDSSSCLPKGDYIQFYHTRERFYMILHKVCYSVRLDIFGCPEKRARASLSCHEPWLRYVYII